MKSLSVSLRDVVAHPLTLPFYLPWLLFAIAHGLLIPVMPLYVASFDVGYSMIGLVLAGEALGTLLADVPAGVLLRRMGTRRSMLLGLICVLVANVLLFWAGTIALVFAARLVSGFGRAMFGVSQHTYLATSVEVDGRGRAIALYGGIMRMGVFIGPIVGGAVAYSAGLRAPFLLYGVLCLASVIVVALLLPDLSVRAAGDSRHSGYLVPVIRDHYRVFLSAGAGQLFGAMVRAGRTVVIPLFAADVLNLDELSIGLVIGIAGLADMLMFYVAGWVMDNLGRKYAIVPCFAGQGIGMALIPLTGGFGGLLLVTILIGVANGLGSGTMMTLGSDLAPPEARGEFLGVWRLIGDSGVMAAPLIVGGIADLLVLSGAAVAMAGAGVLSALIFGLAVPETLKRPRP